MTRSSYTKLDLWIDRVVLTVAAIAVIYLLLLGTVA